MNRFSIGLTDDQLAYVEERTDETTSRADVIRAIIDAHRSGSDQTGADTEPNQTEPVTDLAERLAHLEEDVGELRVRLETVESTVQPGRGDDSFKSGRSEAESGALSRGDEERMEHLDPSEEMDGSTPDDGGEVTDAPAWPAVEDLPALHYREEPDDDLERSMRDALDDLTITGRGAATKRVRREAAVWAWNYLREHGTRRSSEIANATFGAYWDRDHLGYSTSGAGPYAAYGLWDSYLRDVLKQLPGVEAPPERGSRWRFDEGADPGEDSGVYDPTAEF